MQNCEKCICFSMCEVSNFEENEKVTEFIFYGARGREEVIFRKQFFLQKFEEFFQGYQPISKK